MPRSARYRRLLIVFSLLNYILNAFSTKSVFLKVLFYTFFLSIHIFCYLGLLHRAYSLPGVFSIWLNDSLAFTFIIEFWSTFSFYMFLSSNSIPIGALCTSERGTVLFWCWETGKKTYLGLGCLSGSRKRVGRHPACCCHCLPWQPADWQSSVVFIWETGSVWPEPSLLCCQRVGQPSELAYEAGLLSPLAYWQFSLSWFFDQKS